MRAIRLAWRGLAGALALLLSGPALAQTLGQGGDEGVSLWRVLAALILCLALAAAGAFALRARLDHGVPFAGAMRRPRRLGMVESMRLPNQATLCIVTCDDRELLIGVSAHGVALLEPLPDAAARRDGA